MEQGNAIQIFIKKYFYDSNDGDIYEYKTGKSVGSQDTKGYYRVYVNKEIKYLGKHKIIFAMHHGYIPEVIDHKDRDKNNNKIILIQCCYI